jgi:hypothetical protein
MLDRDASLDSGNTLPTYGDKFAINYLNEIGKLRAALILYLDAGVGNSIKELFSENGYVALSDIN